MRKNIRCRRNGNGNFRKESNIISRKRKVTRSGAGAGHVHVLVTISNAAFKDADGIDYKEAVDVMNAVGVFVGDEKGNFNARKPDP